MELYFSILSSLILWRKYYPESPKQGRKRFNYIAKKKYIADLGIIYLKTEYFCITVILGTLTGLIIL